MAALTESTSILLVTAKPTDPGNVTNELRFHYGTLGQMVAWRWNGTSWVGYSVTPIFYNGNPGGNVTSDCANQLCVDTGGYALYYCATEGSTTWTQVV